MSAKEVKFSVDARDRMLHGIDTLTHAVRVTLGPKGRNVLLDKSFGAPRMTKLPSPRQWILSPTDRWPCSTRRRWSAIASTFVGACPCKSASRSSKLYR